MTFPLDHIFQTCLRGLEMSIRTLTRKQLPLPLSSSESVIWRIVPSEFPIKSRVSGVRKWIVRSWIYTYEEENWKGRAEIQTFSTTLSRISRFLSYNHGSCSKTRSRSQSSSKSKNNLFSPMSLISKSFCVIQRERKVATYLMFASRLLGQKFSNYQETRGNQFLRTFHTVLHIF